MLFTSLHLYSYKDWLTEVDEREGEREKRLKWTSTRPFIRYLWAVKFFPAAKIAHFGHLDTADPVRIWLFMGQYVQKLDSNGRLITAQTNYKRRAKPFKRSGGNTKYICILSSLTRLFSLACLGDAAVAGTYLAHFLGRQPCDTFWLNPGPHFAVCFSLYFSADPWAWCEQCR